MKRYLVTSEIIAVHEAVVEAIGVDEAAEVYLSGEFIEDLGETFDEDSAMVLSVEELSEDEGN